MHDATPHVRHGLAAGADFHPDRPDWTIDQGWENYTAEEHATWKTLFERQTALLQGRACAAFVDGMRHLPIAADAIPDFRRLSEVLLPRTGWQIVAVPGLVPDEVFFDHLANRRFPAGRFIRRPQELDYLEEPDVFHDVFGHVPLLLNPAMADFIQAYGQGGLRSRELGALDQLARVYWYTVEFGLVREAGGLRIYGAGIASSYTESVFALDSPSPHRVGFDLARVMRTRYCIDDFQESYFVIDSLDQLLELASVDFAPVYAAAAAQPECAPGELLPQDQVLSRGTGSHRHGS
ncbi:phenylalanine 4-monooxygenase [Xylophilus sp.]|uniref:phenylalanine 4-monooxygenase n=1 Tax=Xylophilus sp. TaxID=2653893 RepID=UPI0013BD157A|nr:phenylalanine 4-monooxygenase [Xylophilus sp.]KAF1041973.1 MAG: Phenylalanine-4-hydroxylase [Xylophilus sp.]